MPRIDADLYDYLATSKVSEVTVSQLEQALENSFINKSNIEFWKGAITVQRLLEVSRTYPHGLPIPETGEIVETILGTGEDFDIQPPGSEIWRITGMNMTGAGGTSEAAISYSDGITGQPIAKGLAITAAGVIIGAYGAVSDIQIMNPILLTNAVYWKVFCTSLSYGMMVAYSYQKVSL